MEEKQLVNLVGAGNTESQEKIEKPTLSFTQDVWRRLKKKIGDHITLVFSNSTGLFNWIKFLC